LQILVVEAEPPVAVHDSVAVVGVEADSTVAEPCRSHAEVAAAPAVLEIEELRSFGGVNEVSAILGSRDLVPYMRLPALAAWLEPGQETVDESDLFPPVVFERLEEGSHYACGHDPRPDQAA
jgi:hypothetical protein